MKTSRSWAGAAAAAVVLALSVGACTSSPPSALQPSTPSTPRTSPSRLSGIPTITILGAGDVLLHPPLWDQAKADGGGSYDFRPILSGVQGAVSAADLAVCHLETPVAAATGPFTGYPSFSVPPQVATAIRLTGFDTCSTASNHTLDDGEAGVDRTLDALDAAGLHHAGSYRSAAAQMIPNIIEVKGVRVAQLSYTFGFNGLQRPAGKNWIANLIDPAAIIAEAHRARQAGAEIVVVSMHWGTEYEHAPDADQQKWAKQLLDSPDIDLILGCHAHVVQPFEKINDKWVVYGMGNEIARHDDPVDATREGVMPLVTFSRTTPGHWWAVDMEAIPTWVDLTPSLRIVDLPDALATNAHTNATVAATYQAAYDRISGYLRSRGADASILRIQQPSP